MNAKRFDQLTGLRFIAALGVLLCHYAAVLRVPEPLIFLTDFFGSFVALFFVLSGYVLTHTYANRLNEHHAFGRYFIARFARIVPMYWLALVTTLAVYAGSGYSFSQGGSAHYAFKEGSFFINLLALQAWIPDIAIQQYWNAPGWSVSAELFFYLCLPVLLRWRWIDGSLQSFSVIWVSAALLLCTSIILSARYLADDPAAYQVALAYLLRCPLLGLYCFVLGMHLARSRQPSGFRPRNSPWTVRLALLGTLTVATSYAVVHLASPEMSRLSLQVVATYLVYTPFFYALIAYLLHSKGTLVRQLSTRPMVALGDASYALYLLHWIPLSVLLSGPTWLRDYQSVPWLVAGATVLLSLFLFRIYEQPMRTRIRRIKFSRRTP